MVVIPSGPPSTGRSEALASQLRVTIADFRARHPKVSDDEVAQALSAVGPPIKKGSSKTSREAILAGVGIAVALLIGIVVSVMQRASRPASPVLVALGVAGAVGAVVVLILRSRRG